MINCPARFDIFDRALAGMVKDKVVVDIGAGTGLLALSAASHGARKVYAVERDARVVPYLERLVRSSPYSDRIVPVHAIFSKLDGSHFPEGVDVFVSETMGRAWFEEGIHDIAVHALSLFPGARFVPGTATLYGRIFSDSEFFHQAFGVRLPFLKQLGFDELYKNVYATYPGGLFLNRDNFNDAVPLSEPFKIGEWVAGAPFSASHHVQPVIGETVSSGWLVLWFDSLFDGHVAFSTDPSNNERTPTFRNAIFHVSGLSPGNRLHFRFDPKTYDLSYEIVRDQ